MQTLLNLKVSPIRARCLVMGDWNLGNPKGGVYSIGGTPQSRMVQEQVVKLDVCAFVIAAK